MLQPSRGYSPHWSPQAEAVDSPLSQLCNNRIMTMNPIGIFDSGLGGLSVLREVRSLLPKQTLLYFADHARLPYGVRPLTELRRFSEEITRFLLARRAKTIVVACNTASAAALHHLRDTFPDTSFVGMEPAVKPAAYHSRAKTVGVLATEATFQGKLFSKAMELFAQEVTVLTEICPGWVDLVERGNIESSRTSELISKHVMPLVQSGADTLVLGCTHYSFLKDAIEELLDPSIEIIDPSRAVARQVKHVFTQDGVTNSVVGESSASITIYTTSNQIRFIRKRVRDLLGLDVEIRQAVLDTPKYISN